MPLIYVDSSTIDYCAHAHRGIHDLDLVAARFCRMGGSDWPMVKLRRHLQGWKHETPAMYREFMSHLDRVPLAMLGRYCSAWTPPCAALPPT